MILRLLRALRTFPKELPPKTKGEKKMAGCVSPSSSSWKPLLRKALDSNAHLKHSVFFQLATIGANGRPSNRTVVFRGFQENGDKIQINTDVRSNKIEEIKHCPFGEICWYFTDSWEQFRINGTIDFIDGSNSDPAKLQQREKAWFMSSLKSRMQYLGPAPGIPVIDEGTAKENHLDPTAGPVDAFCLLVFDPEQVDYLNLKSNERLMFRSRQSSDGGKGWMFERVNP
ncbi:pyridoxine/pyridoxamine 5'-phosphate oxidase 2 [Ananas comosus]|uniref:pyridoxal 5'-phosphate synthase n=2 Tax=Ananas comosus TaxID=4615 RepID=A0A6P5ETD1_ANACO|nr:pyridoxine/pyridoxamine 5'-phosphate oxidase 2 [Ananas comosus]